MAGGEKDARREVDSSEASLNPLTAERMFELVYRELHGLAAKQLNRQSPAHSLSATALVHEAFLRLARGESGALFADRNQFLSLAAKAMQNILVDHARRKRAGKRGGGALRFRIQDTDRIEIPDPDLLLAVNEAVERLALEDPSAAQLARLHLFAGLSVEEAGCTLGVSRATAFREWSYAKAYIATAIADPADSSVDPHRQRN